MESSSTSKSRSSPKRLPGDSCNGNGNGKNGGGVGGSATAPATSGSAQQKGNHWVQPSRLKGSVNSGSVDDTSSKSLQSIQQKTPNSDKDQRSTACQQTPPSTTTSKRASSQKPPSPVPSKGAATTADGGGVKRSVETLPASAALGGDASHTYPVSREAARTVAAGGVSGEAKKAQEQQQEQQEQQKPENDKETPQELADSASTTFSPRAMACVTRINHLMQRCHYFQCLADRAAAGEYVDVNALPPETANWVPPTEDEQVMYEVLLSLYNTPIGPLFLSQPEISLSNRSCVLATPGFAKGELIAGYTVCAPYNPGTIGRSYFAARKPCSASSSGEDVAAAVAAAVSQKGASSPVHSPSFSLAEVKMRKSAMLEKDLRNFSVMKVISFRLRKEIVRGVISDQCILTKLRSDTLLKVNDVLKDQYLEKVIVITLFQQKGNLCQVAGKLDDDPDRLRRISIDVAVGLHLLHSHKVFHHNLKLENVLETAESHYCIADAGFYRLFVSQCPEALIFNGELASLPPELFDENGPYYSAEPWNGVEYSTDANGSQGTQGGSTDEGAAASSSGSHRRFSAQHQQETAHILSAMKVDVWGYGVLLYRLVYGRDPFEIAMRNVEEVRYLLQSIEPVYPPKPMWPFYAELVALMEACLQKNPANRPDMSELLRMPYFRDTGAPGSAVSVPRNVSMTTSTASAAFAASGNYGRPASSSGTLRNQSRNGYTADTILGTGRVSQTMLVHQRRNVQKRFAFKMLKKSVLKRLQAIHQGAKTSNAVKEARVHAIMRSLAICRKVAHPNLVQYVDIVEDKKGHCFVVQEYMKNGPLLAMPMLSSPAGKPSGVENLLADVLLALVHLHDNEIAHLTLTPSNIFYDDVTGRFRVADFGPLFLSIEDVTDAEAKGKPIYSLPSWILAEKPMNKYHIDTYFVGLLAASVVPSLFSSIWDQLFIRHHSTSSSPTSTAAAGNGNHSGRPQQQHESAERGVSVQEILRAVRTASKVLPPALVDFIKVALSEGKTARQLLEHPFFGGKYPSGKIPVDRVEVTPEEIAVALKARPPPRDEQQPMVDVLGQDPFMESQMLSSVTGEFDMSMNTNDKSLVIAFNGDCLRCGQCRAPVNIALYRCSTCPDVVRCGKCAVNDSHQLGHCLVPYVIRLVERGLGNTRRAQLCHPSSIQDVHALETLEMGANFPVGALSGYTANQRMLERSMARSVILNNVGASQRQLFSGTELCSSTYLQDPECSVSALGVRSFANLKPTNSAYRFLFTGQQTLREHSVLSTVENGPGGSTHNGAVHGQAATTNSQAAAAAPSGDPHGVPGQLNAGNLRNLISQNPPPAASGFGGGGGGGGGGFGGGGKGNLLSNAAKKYDLPKAEDLDDLPWEEELRLCREGESAELLLFNYGFSQVPSEVFTPPPLHVVSLDLSQNSLTSLPHELCFLAHLRKLIVSYNKLASLPDSIGNLRELESIDASHNVLLDLPMTFVYLANLRSCAMDYNSFSRVPQSVLDIFTPNQLAATMGTAEEHSVHSGTFKDAKQRERIKDGKHGKSAGSLSYNSSSGSSSGGSSNNSGSSNSSSSSGSSSDDEDKGDTPNLSVLYLAANDSIVSLPDIDKMRRFSNVKIALDNEPSLYKQYMRDNWERQLPNVSITWNKIYPDEIIPNLYCGSLRSAQSQMVYKKLKITYVLTVGRGLIPVPPDGGRHKTIVVDDIPGADILVSIQEAIDFIEESQQEGSGCLVHCFAGLSRSATTVIAYLMVKKHMRMDEAYLVAKRGRPAILPNSGFFQQLIGLDKSLYPNAERPLDIASLSRPPDDAVSDRKE